MVDAWKDEILSISAPELVGRVSIASNQSIASRTADDVVVAETAVDLIVARAADQGIRTASRNQAADEQIVAVAAVQGARGVGDEAIVARRPGEDHRIDLRGVPHGAVSKDNLLDRNPVACVGRVDRREIARNRERVSRALQLDLEITGKPRSARRHFAQRDVGWGDTGLHPQRIRSRRARKGLVHDGVVTIAVTE